MYNSSPCIFMYGILNILQYCINAELSTPGLKCILELRKFPNWVYSKEKTAALRVYCKWQRCGAVTLLEVVKFVMFCPSSAPPLLHSDYWMGETRGGWGKCHGRVETPEQCMWQWLASLKASKEHCALDPGCNVNSDSLLWWSGKSSSIQAYVCGFKAHSRGVGIIRKMCYRMGKINVNAPSSENDLESLCS